MVNHFHFIIGDYLGAAKEVRWKNDVLTICTELVVVEAYAGCKNYSVPSNDERLQSVFNYLSKSTWKENYDHPYTCDGYYWRLELIAEDGVLICNGTNKAPRGFKTFLKLLNAITKAYGLNVC
ncbi:MAG: hypothetical protein ACTHMD_08370 [Flavisolibacter sp.]